MPLDTTLTYWEQVRRILYYVGYAFIALFLVFIIWTVSCIISWLFRIILHQIFQSCIQKNKTNRKQLLGMTQSSFVESHPLQLVGLTRSRLKCLELIVCYVIVAFGIWGVFALDQIMEGLLGISWLGGLGVILVVIFTEIKGLHFVSSFLARFVILWNDTARIHDHLMYKDNPYIIMYITIFSIGIRELGTKASSYDIEHFSNRIVYSILNIPNFVFLTDSVKILYVSSERRVNSGESHV